MRHPFLAAAIIMAVCLPGPAVMAQQSLSCDGLGLDERGKALCQSWFAAYGCGGGLQREELRCHRLGQEFEHQTGIPYRLLPGLAGTTGVFDGNGGQLNLGEFIELKLPAGVLDSGLRLGLRLTPKSATDAFYRGASVERAVFDIRVSAGPSRPATGEALTLELERAPFMATLGDDAGAESIRLRVLGYTESGSPEPLPLPVGERKDGRVFLSLPAGLFIRDEALTGEGYEAVISVVLPETGAPGGAPEQGTTAE